MNGGVKLTGNIHLLLKDRFGNVKDERHIKNAIALVGKAELTAFMAADIGGATGFDYIAIGVGAPAAAFLGSESTTNGGAKRGGDGTVVGTQEETTTADDTAQFVTTFTFTGALALTEAGIFNAAVANTGIMLASQNFSALNVADTDTLTITWRVKVA